MMGLMMRSNPKTEGKTLVDPITNDDGHTVDDLRPPFPISTLESYLDDAELLNILDLHSEETIRAIERHATNLETALVNLHRSPLDDRVIASLLGSIADNSRDVAHDSLFDDQCTTYLNADDRSAIAEEN